MADNQKAHVPGGGFRKEEVPDLRLGDKVQHGTDLIGQKESSLGSQGSRDTKPLQLSS